MTFDSNRLKQDDNDVDPPWRSVRQYPTEVPGPVDDATSDYSSSPLDRLITLELWEGFRSHVRQKPDD